MNPFGPLLIHINRLGICSRVNKVLAFSLTKGLQMPARCKRSNAAIASSKSWERANKLFSLAECGNTTLARSFIAANRQLESILDGRIDKRNMKVRSIISDYSRWIKRNTKK